ncbi:MAG: AAA family ATPase [Vescimonas sp.]
MRDWAQPGKNIGPYVNEKCLLILMYQSITKRMVLIGGKNGAGKTTLFNAIKICLYGCVAYGFESKQRKVLCRDRENYQC